MYNVYSINITLMLDGQQEPNVSESNHKKSNDIPIDSIRVEKESSTPTSLQENSFQIITLKDKNR